LTSPSVFFSAALTWYAFRSAWILLHVNLRNNDEATGKNNNFVLATD